MQECANSVRVMDRNQMLAKVKQSLLLLDPRERVLIIILTALRALLGLLDIAGIFLIGLLLGKGTNQITGTNSANKSMEFILELSGDLGLLQIASSSINSIFIKISLCHSTNEIHDD